MAVEYPTLVSVILTDTFEEWRIKTNAIIAHTEAAAQNVGNLNFLNTDGKTTIVDALNEVDTHTDTNTTNIGNMSDIDNKIKKATLVDTLNQAVQYHEKYTTDAVAAEAAIRLAKDNSLQSELDATQTAAGLTNSGTYVAPTSTYLGNSTSIMGGMLNLDTNLKSTADLLEVLIDTVGANEKGVYNYTGDTVYYLQTPTTGNAKVKSALIQLDNQIHLNADNISNNVTAHNDLAGIVDNIKTSIGLLTADGSYEADERNDYAGGVGATSVRDDISFLDNQVASISNKLTEDVDDINEAIKLNIDNISANAVAHNTLAEQVESLRQALGMINTSFNYTTISGTNYAKGTTVAADIKALDDTLHGAILQLTGETETSIANISGDLSTKADKVVVGNREDLKGEIGNTSNIVAAINSLYDLVAPLINGASTTPFVLKTGDTMSGTLTIDGGNLIVTGNQGLYIKSSGDVIAYAD